MPRKVSQVSALNIKTHPHSPDLYVNLIYELYKLGMMAKIRGDNFGMLGSVWHRQQDNPLEGLEGVFYKFLNIDPSSPWLNLQTKEIVQYEDKGEPTGEFPVPDQSH